MAARCMEEGEAGLKLGKALHRRERQHPAHEAEIVLLGISWVQRVSLRVHGLMIGRSVSWA
jgi:hypothetical protein